MAKKNIMQIIFVVVLVIVLCIIVRLFIDEKNTISTATNNNSMFSQMVTWISLAEEEVVCGKCKIVVI